MRRLLIALTAGAVALVVLGVLALPAGAQRRTLLVTLLGGQKVVVTVDLPPGAPVTHIPGISLPIVGIQEIGSSPSPTPSTSTSGGSSSGGGSSTGGGSTSGGNGTQSGSANPSTGGGSGGGSTGPRPHPGHVGAAPKGSGKGKGKHHTGGGSTGGGSTGGGSTGGSGGGGGGAKRGNGGAPTPANPTFSLAQPGPAPMGVPNFFIDRFRIPPFLLPIYQAAGIQYGIPWQVLAGINEIETDYGRNLSISTAGAVGWMQFLPSTWRRYGVDANGDGRKDPYNPVDAIFGAARYLKAAGGDKNIKQGIFAYNHADWYVSSVLLRARLIGGLPDALIGSLTGLTQGHFPVAAEARYADDLNEKQATARVKGTNAAVPVDSNAKRRSIDIFSKRNAPVIAVQDGRIDQVGSSPRLGRYVVLEDVYGNRYTYGHLGSVSKYYAVPKPKRFSPADLRKELEKPKADPKPSGPASAGAQPAAPTARRTAKQARRAATAPRRQGPRVGTKERLFAHPDRAAARKSGGARQLVSHPRFTSFKNYFTVALGLKRRDVELKRLKPGSQVIAGTILGRIGQTGPTTAPHMSFEIRPAGRGAPRIDPKPVLDGWKLLEATAVYRAAGKNPFFGPDAKNPTIGQILLMSKENLSRRVLADPGLDIYPCGRQDIEAGAIDRRVLATMEYLVASGLKLTITSLKCGHSYLTTSGNVSEHSAGSAMDIAKVNGIPILGHQGAGSITELTIRRLLLLQGTMKPHQIISLMSFRGADNTLVLPDHANHIHVGFRPNVAPNGKLGRQLAAIMKPGQWLKLIDRLNEIPEPKVAVKPSRFSVPAKKGRDTAAGGD